MVTKTQKKFFHLFVNKKGKHFNFNRKSENAFCRPTIKVELIQRSSHEEIIDFMKGRLGRGFSEAGLISYIQTRYGERSPSSAVLRKWLSNL